jgi:hypothetical protein
MNPHGKYKYYAGLIMRTLKKLSRPDGDEFQNAIIRYDVIPLTWKYFETRFTNTLKQFNNVPERAFDLYMTRKNMESFDQFVEETYLLVAKQIHHRQIIPLKLMLAKEDRMGDYFYTVRKELRHITHVLHHEINENTERIDAEIEKRMNESYEN